MTGSAPNGKPLRLGQRVKFAATLRRAAQYAPLEKGQWTNRRMKVWKRGDYFDQPDPGEGVVFGLRTLSDGFADWEGEDIGFSFSPTTRHRAVLIATELRRRPVLALAEDVEPVVERDPTAELVEALEVAAPLLGIAAKALSAPDSGMFGVVEQLRRAHDQARAALAKWKARS